MVIPDRAKKITVTIGTAWSILCTVYVILASVGVITLPDWSAKPEIHLDCKGAANCPEISQRFKDYVTKEQLVTNTLYIQVQLDELARRMQSVEDRELEILKDQIELARLLSISNNNVDGVVMLSR